MVVTISGVAASGGRHKLSRGDQSVLVPLLAAQGRCSTQAMNAPTSIDKAVKIERYVPALRAASAACARFYFRSLFRAITASTRFSASACDSPVRAETSCAR